MNSLVSAHHRVTAILSCTLLLFAALDLYAQSATVTGSVSDKHENLAGVSVLVKGSGVGTQTNESGIYNIVAGSRDTLVFSYIGMVTQSVAVANRRVINVILTADNMALDEVVVVGYGQAKRSSLTGAIGDVSGATLRKGAGATPNAANLLQGRIAGLEITRPSGRPGNDSPNIRLRGLGSFGASSSPLVLVDGVLGSLTNIAPDDIENITVMKDASSASIYGARAANGVVLITTRKAKKGETILEYKLDIGFQTPTRLPDLIWNSGEYMEMSNTARQRSGLTPFYTADQVASYKNATDKTQYPDFNWPEYYFKTAQITNHYINVSKGSESSKFRLGLNYSNQNGILPGFDSKRISANLNFENTIKKIVRIGTTINFFRINREEPQGAAGTTDLIRGVYGRSPLAGPFLPDGRKSSGRAYSTEPFSTFAPLAFSNGTNKYESYNTNAQLYAIVDIAKGLAWETKGAVNLSQNFSKAHSYATPGQFYFYQKFPGQNDYSLDEAVGRPLSLGVTDNINFSLTPTLYSTLKYNKQIGSHEINSMAGYEQQSNKYRLLSGRRIQFPSTSLEELNAGSPDGQSLSGTATEWALRSYFGRVAYNYKEKYFLEGNLRYDGTSRVHKDNRWGAFSSISGAWRISEEAFLKNNIKWLNNFKIRGSYGLLGNQEIGLYPYQDIFSYSNYSYGTSVEQGVVLSRMTDKKLQWEKTRILDFGLDVEVLSNKLGFTFDWYRKHTYDILATLPVPSSLGLAGPVTNNGSLNNTGIELEINHSNSIGEFNYGAAFQISGFRNKVVSIVTPTKGAIEVGLPYNSLYIHEWVGLFQSQEDINNSAKQNNNPKPGDLKMRDLDGNGVIDAGDRISYSRFPKFNYSFNMNMEWKRFSLSIFFQGVRGSHQFLSDWSSFPYREGIPPHAEFRNAWTPENPTSNIPAVHEFSYAGIYGYSSTYLLKESSYLRMKNIHFSYLLPSNWAKKVWLKDVSLYISGNDLLTFTKFKYGDPEVTEGTSAIQYPQLRSTNIGINIKF